MTYALLIAAGTLTAGPPAEPAAPVPWKVNRPIVTIKKELNRKRPMGGGAALYYLSYIGPKLELMETSAVEVRDDIASEIMRRFSHDNGRTWSQFERRPESLSYPTGVEVCDSAGDWVYDPQADALIQLVLRQVSWNSKPVSYLGANNFTYYRVSTDRGRTWTEPKQLKYEDGDPFDLENPLKETFLRRNQG
jgi:hypothetical protein